MPPRAVRLRGEQVMQVGGGGGWGPRTTGSVPPRRRVLHLQPNRQAYIGGGGTISSTGGVVWLRGPPQQRRTGVQAHTLPQDRMNTVPVTEFSSATRIQAQRTQAQARVTCETSVSKDLQRSQGLQSSPSDFASTLRRSGNFWPPRPLHTPHTRYQSTYHRR